jgi:hypothetical protein
MRMRKPEGARVASVGADRSIELVCLALVMALVMLAVRIVSTL